MGKTKLYYTVGHSEGAPPDLKGKHPFTLYIGFTPGTPVLHTIPPPTNSV